jgi:hypothetical protein
MSEFAFYIHTHTDCVDAMQMCLGQLEKYFPNNKVYIATNSHHAVYGDHTVVLYDESQPYTKRLSETIKTVEEDTVLYMHEDMILYKQPNQKELTRVVQLMDQHGIDFIRLCPNLGIGHQVLKNICYYYGEYYFSVQPTLWKKKSLQNFMSEFSMGIWELESKGQSVCRLKYSGYTYFVGDEPMRGECHHDSFIFPYIATAIVKGKWNTAEYSKELHELMEEYDIKSDRKSVQ